MRRNNTTFKNLKNQIAIGLVLLISLCLGFFSAPQSADAAAASLYLSPSTGTYVIGGTFNVGVKVNSGGDVINASQGSISYDTGLLDVVSISKGGTIFPFWTTEPSHSGGTINFGGGLPPPAYNGSAGHIFSVTFRAKKAGTAQVRFTSGAVLANDGKGTNVLASMGSGSYTLAPKSEAPKTTPGTPAEKPIIEPDYNKPVITSPTHPDQDAWYSKNDISFAWKLPENVNGVSIAFDDNGYSDPGPGSDGLFGEKEYPDVKDGHVYFHLKYKDSARWSSIAHYRVNIDTVPPDPFELEVIYHDEDWPELKFKAEDKLSGIIGYELFTGDLNKGPEVLSATTTSYIVRGLEVGEYTVMVKAIDRAGNERLASAKVEIWPIEAPEITHYAKEVRSSDNFYVSGTAIKNSDLKIYIQKGQGQIIEGESESDVNGNWFYVHDDKLGNGRYIAWAEAVNAKGLHSGPSRKVTFLVSPPVFTTIGSYVINYFTVFVSLIFMIILIIVLILWLIGWIRKRLKKETKEIEEILHANALEMKKTIDNEFAGLSKSESKAAAYQGAKKLANERLKSKVDINEKKILKEIQDVEEILK